MIQTVHGNQPRVPGRLLPMQQGGEKPEEQDGSGSQNLTLPPI